MNSTESTTNETVFIEFDIPAICQLKADYEKTIEFILDELPDVNWNSYQDTYGYFSEEYNIHIGSTRIQSLYEFLDDLDNNPETTEFAHNINECKELLQGLIELKKLQFTLRNYINNILKHNEGGVYNLRLVNGEWKMQNKRDLPYSPDILECVISKSDNI